MREIAQVSKDNKSCRSSEKCNLELERTNNYEYPDFVAFLQCGRSPEKSELVHNSSESGSDDKEECYFGSEESDSKSDTEDEPLGNDEDITSEKESDENNDISSKELLERNPKDAVLETKQDQKLRVVTCEKKNVMKIH